MSKPNYFLVAVSTCQHLELCLKYAIAGFSNSVAGAWTFVEIQEGDFVSFLHAARAFNLYEVTRKEAIVEFEKMPPWPSVAFRDSRKPYLFPFRLYLRPIREFCEPLVRPEFAYVAENLLLRAGYRKTHFQADQTTLQNVSQMGSLWNGDIQPLETPPHTTFEPKFTPDKKMERVPFVCHFQESILQAAIKRWLSDRGNFTKFLSMIGFEDLSPDELEVLGEKALSYGHVDILIKDRVPIAQARKIAVEVKREHAQPRDLRQLRGYIDELGSECIGGVLIANSFSKSVIREAPKRNIRLVRYELRLDWRSPKKFSEILAGLRMEALP
ncbi:Endonuclease NucS [bacterium HR17]|uniref:Endonuclease NucS n=1 Tax=Candidatus Fervidibacter japonicus TaxID=2035412 RepID=A0A2H5X9E8_9BACT|nr:Endonuclease NucS [bacterium HR17]